MKKVFSLLILFSLLFSLSMTVSADNLRAYSFVDDQAGLLTDQEKMDLTILARKVSDKADCGIYIVTVDDYRDLGYDEFTYISDVLEHYYADQGYGYGADQSGVILMLSMKARDYSLSTFGFGYDGLSDPAKHHIADTFLNDFGKDSWYHGFKDYIKSTGEMLQMSRNGHPFDENSATHGEKALGVVLCILISAAIACLITRYFEKQMDSVALKTDAAAFAGMLYLTKKDEHYMNTTTSRVYDPPTSSSGSGSSGSSGGGHSQSISGKF